MSQSFEKVTMKTLNIEEKKVLTSYFLVGEIGTQRTCIF